MLASGGWSAWAAVFAQAEPWLDAAVAQIDENRRLAEQSCARSCEASRTNREASNTDLLLGTAETAAGLGVGAHPGGSLLVERGRVAETGCDFGEQGAGFARLNIGTSPELITEAVHRMALAVPAGDVLAGGDRCCQYRHLATVLPRLAVSPFLSRA